MATRDTQLTPHGCAVSATGTVQAALLLIDAIANSVRPSRRELMAEIDVATASAKALAASLDRITRLTRKAT